MPIYIKDETANALVLTIDDNGNMAFGDGTPINKLTLNGYGIIDSEGYIVHGLGASTVTANSGSVTVGVGHAVQINTIAGVTPIVQLDSRFPAWFYNIDPVGEFVREPIGGPEFLATPNPGSFWVQTLSFVLNFDIITPGNPNYHPELQNLTVRYRWI